MMTRLRTLSCLLAALYSACCVLADSLPQQSPSPALWRLENGTPLPGLPEDPVHLEARQNLAVAPNPVKGPAQMPSVTVYSLEVQVGATAVQKQFTYTQTFAAVPDQYPAAKVGKIGYGTLQQKREAEPTPETNTVTQTQTFVLAMETAIVMQPVQKVTEVLVVQTMNVFESSRTSGNETAEAIRGTGAAVASLARHLLPTATG